MSETTILILIILALTYHVAASSLKQLHMIGQNNIDFKRNSDQWEGCLFSE